MVNCIADRKGKFLQALAPGLIALGRRLREIRRTMAPAAFKQLVVARFRLSAQQVGRLITLSREEEAHHRELDCAEPGDPRIRIRRAAHWQFSRRGDRETRSASVVPKYTENFSEIRQVFADGGFTVEHRLSKSGAPPPLTKHIEEQITGRVHHRRLLIKTRR